MKKIQLMPFFTIIATAFVGCGEQKSTTDNPLLMPYETPFNSPPFDKIKTEHFRPAFQEALKQHTAEIDSITSIEAAPTFDNTILAYENSGQLLHTISSVFFNINEANTNDSLQAIEHDMAPVLSQHSDEILLNSKLFDRVKAVWTKKDSLKLDSESLRLVDETYLRFVRAGANLKDQKKENLKKINAELAVLYAQFSQNLLAETNDYELVLDSVAQLEGLPESVVKSAAEAAKAKGKAGKWVFTLHNPSIMPFLQFAKNRDLRRNIWDAYQTRGNNDNNHDNKSIIVKIANLRLKRANILGFKTHAAYVLQESMAKNPSNVLQMLDKLWSPALKKAESEAANLQHQIKLDSGDFELEPFDWRYYTEQIRQKKYALNEDELKPYFSLTDVREGAFMVAKKLYGLSFVALNNVPVYHKDVQVFEVRDRDGKHLGLLYADFYQRESKRGGAWMTTFREQSTNNGVRISPLVSIVCNFSKPMSDQPSLLTFDEANTLFHEFGHALHGLLSNVHYRSLAGTNVSRDFVELPSQVMENWASDPEVLRLYAKHYRTKEVIPDSLITKLQNTKTFDQGFATVEYLAASYLDFSFNNIDRPLKYGVNTIEERAMKRIGLIDAIIPRYRSTYFQHVFGGGYDAGYYAYIWAEMLDADAFAAFKEKGIFDEATAQAFEKNILEKGNTADPAVLYRQFRGKDPNPDYLLIKRGLN